MKKLLSLTPTELEIYNIIKTRMENDLITTRLDIMNTAGLSSRSWTYIVLRSLIKKGLVQRYKKQYYRAKK